MGFLSSPGAKQVSVIQREEATAGEAQGKWRNMGVVANPAQGGISRMLPNRGDH